MAKCKKCQNIYNLSNKDDVIVGKWCPKINDSPNIERERECKHFKAMSNADKIRSMTDEELAEFINGFSTICELCNLHAGCCNVENTKCKNGILDWLQSEAE